MAVKVAKSARLGFVLNAGVTPGTGMMKKESVSVTKIMPESDPDALGAVGDAVGTLLSKPVVMVSLVETSQIV